MSKPYDAATKYLIDLDPVAWLRLAGIPTESLPPAGDVTPVELSLEQVDTDLSTVTAAADRLLKANLPTPRLYHIELQSSADTRLDERVHWYHTLARYEYRLPVRSLVFLLRPSADSPQIHGGFSETDNAHVLQFRYQIIRLWQFPADALLQGGLATLPLAPLAARDTNDATRIVRQMQTRLIQETTPDQENQLWTAAYVLMGLNYTRPQIDLLMKGVRQMRDSVTYQAILEEGREEGREQGREQGLEQGAEALRQFILRVGTNRFGAPDDTVKARLAQLTLTQVQPIADRLLKAESWTELLP